MLSGNGLNCHSKAKVPFIQANLHRQIRWMSIVLELILGHPKSVSLSIKTHHFLNAITAYRKVPFANPLLIARKA